MMPACRIPLRAINAAVERRRYDQALGSLDKRLRRPVPKQEAQAIARVRCGLLKAKTRALESARCQ